LERAETASFAYHSLKLAETAGFVYHSRIKWVARLVPVLSKRIVDLQPVNNLAPTKKEHNQQTVTQTDLKNTPLYRIGFGRRSDTRFLSVLKSYLFLESAFATPSGTNP
jgi:hypothetical protein